MEDDALSSCPVCLNDYNLQERTPRLLPCTHSLCQECVGELIRPRYPPPDDEDIYFDSDEDINEESLTCPICRAEHITDDRRARGFGENQYIVAALERQEKEFSRCPKHNREMTLYCRNQSCLKLICAKCHLREHKMHNVEDIEDQREENKKVITEAKQVVDDGIKKLTKAQDSMIEKLTLSIDEIEKTRDHLKDNIDKIMDNYTKQCMEHHESNMRIIESNKGLLETRVQKLESMKSNASNMRDGNIFPENTLQGIKDGAHFFSKTDGMKCLSYGRKCAKKEKWLLAQLCGAVTESDWSGSTDGVAAGQDDCQQKGTFRQVFVRTPSDKTITLDVDLNQTVDQLKSQIEEKEGLDKNVQALRFAGKFLLNEHILADYGVQRDSTLYLSVSWNAKNKHANSEEKINVTIQNVDGDFLTLEMRAVDTIEGLKITIEGQKSIPRKKQKLVYKGRVLKNQFTLRECNITMDSIIHLMHT